MPSNRSVKLSSFWSLYLTKCDVGNLSSASANHCCSLPYLQTRKTAARIAASVNVNQAPSGTFVSAEDRKVPSKQAKVSHGRKTKNGEYRQTTIAVSDTMRLSK